MKLNKKRKLTKSLDTLTYEDGLAYSYDDPRNELIGIMATSFMDKKFYERTSQTIKRIHKLIDKILEAGHSNFLWNLFYITRKEWHMRSITHIVAGYLLSKGDYLSTYPGELSTILSYAWQRPDDMMETVAYYSYLNGGINMKKGGKIGFPNKLANAIKHRFLRMDEFQASKYHGEGTEYPLRDLIRLVRPTPNGEKQKELFKNIVKRTLPETEHNWRAKFDNLRRQKLEALKEITEEVTDDELQKIKCEAMTEVIDKMGLLGIISNLRSFIEHGVDNQLLIKRLTDKKAVQNSRVLPFRFPVAIENIADREVKVALVKALGMSFDNFILPEGNYLIAVDTSGSMRPGFYRDDKLYQSPIFKAASFGSILARKAEMTNKNKVHLVAFATNLMRIDTFDKGFHGTMMSLLSSDVMNHCEHGTNGHLVYEYAKRKNTPKFDYIFIFTDMQFTSLFRRERTRTFEAGHTSLFSRQRTRTFEAELTPPKDSFIAYIDLMGYDNTQVPFSKIDNRIELAGISEKIFDYLEIAQDPEGMINWITNYQIKTKLKF